MGDIDVICHADWNVPLEKAALLRNVFTTKRRKLFDKSQTFHASASEMVTAIPIVLYFLETQPLIQERLPLQVASWRALERMCRQLLRAKLGIGSSQELASTIRVHAEKYSLAYGDRESAYQPKFHWTFHLPDQYEEDEILLDMWPSERANILFKAAAEPVRNTRGKTPSRWEATVASGVWARHTEYLGLLRPDGVDNGIDCPELGHGAKLASQCVHRGVVLKENNIVFLSEGRPFLLAAFASLPAACFYVGYHCRMLGRRTSNSALYTADAELDFVKFPDLIRVCPIYTSKAGGLLIFDA